MKEEQGELEGYSYTFCAPGGVDIVCQQHSRQQSMTTSFDFLFLIVPSQRGIHYFPVSDGNIRWIELVK